MADVETIARFRLMVDEPDETIYSDAQIDDVIEQADGDLDIAAAELWGMKAARFAGLVDTSESGSSRSMSQLYKNALQMKGHFETRARDEVIVEQSEVRPRVRRAVRL